MPLICFPGRLPLLIFSVALLVALGPLCWVQDFLTLPAYDILIATEFGPTFGAPGGRSKL